MRRWSEPHRGWLGYVAIAAVAFLAYALWQYSPVFADPDSFYHAAAAVELRDGQLPRTFPALPYTTLAERYADQHFLYHLILVPFVSVIDPLVGLKLATVVFGTLLSLILYAFLRHWQVPWAFAASVVLLLVTAFTFRMNLAKASSLSVAVLMLGVWAAFAYRPILLGIVAAFYAWLHGGFPLLAGATILFASVNAVLRRTRGDLDSNTFLHRVRALLGRPFRHRRVRRLNLRIMVAVIVGTMAGVATNPFFPDNLRFATDQLIRIGIVNYQDAIGVGGEWYPYKFIDLIANTVLVSIPVLIAIVLGALQFRRQSARSVTLFCLWLFFLLLTLKSRRYVEYYVPFALLFAAMSLSDSLRQWRWKTLWPALRTTVFGNVFGRIAGVAVVTYVLIVLPTVVIRDQVTNRRDLLNGFALTLYHNESQWIRQHTVPGAVVFHSDWDEFPTLYYWNTDRRFIAGLDPTFLYLADRDRYWQWANLTLGRSEDDPFAVVRGTFDADVVFVTHDHTAMRSLIEADPRFTLGFSGPDANVYLVAPTGTLRTVAWTNESAP